MSFKASNSHRRFWPQFQRRHKGGLDADPAPRKVPKFKERFDEEWRKENEEGYKGLIIPVLLCAGFAVWYMKKTTETARLKLEIDELKEKAKKLQESKEKPEEVVPDDSSAESKEQRREKRLIEKHLSDYRSSLRTKFASESPNIAKKLRIDDKVLLNELNNLVEEPKTEEKSM